jgi:hypothetical protein
MTFLAKKQRKKKFWTVIRKKSPVNKKREKNLIGLLAAQPGKTHPLDP